MTEGFRSSQKAPFGALTDHGGIWVPEQEHLQFPSILQQLLPNCKGWRYQSKDRGSWAERTADENSKGTIKAIRGGAKVLSVRDFDRVGGTHGCEITRMKNRKRRGANKDQPLLCSAATIVVALRYL